MITVVAVIREMGYEPDKTLTWPVGEIVAGRWFSAHGEWPAKLLAEKTNGGGSHCFAHYPDEWIGLIQEVVQRVVDESEAETLRQPDLFG